MFSSSSIINVQAYVSVEPFTPTTGLGMLMTAPTVHVGVQMKEPIRQPFFPSAPGMYDIRFFFNFTGKNSVILVITLGIVEMVLTKVYMG